METIIVTILPFVIKVSEYLFDKFIKNENTKKEILDTVLDFYKKRNDSIKIMEQDKKQSDVIDELIKKDLTILK